VIPAKAQRRRHHTEHARVVNTAARQRRAGYHCRSTASTKLLARLTVAGLPA